MKHFKSRPSSRRDPRPTAAQIILGPEHARAAARGDVSLYLRPVGPHDHRKRFHPGQRLAVRAVVGAPTACHVNVIEVRGPTFDPAPMRLGDVTYDDARAAGHRTTLDFKRAWLARYDLNWPRTEAVPCPDCLGDPDHPSDELPPCGTCGGEDSVDFRPDPADDEIEARIERHAHRPIWAIRYIVDITATDRFMARRFSINSGDYVTTMARALDDDPAVDPETQKTITNRAGMTTQQWQAQEAANHEEQRKALSLEQRITAATRKAQQHGTDVSRELWMVRTTQNQKRPAHMVEKRVEILERKAFTDPLRRAA